jgi:ComF family protein
MLRNFINIVYPPRCHICGDFLGNDDSENQPIFFCRACFSDFSQISSPLCPICGTPFIADSQEDHTCESCLRKRPFYEATYAGYLYRGAIMEAIHQFKYGEKTFLSNSLGPLLSQFAKGLCEKSDNLLTMPVPLHPKRLRERGFNQSLLLARHVAEDLDTELDFLSLRRVRYTSPQTGLGKEERRKNVRAAFHVENPDAVKGMSILLVDDVATTGNTLNECARVLRKSGCKSVLCLVLARAGF